MSINETIADFCNWWRSEMSSLFAALMPKRAKNDTPPDWILVIGKDGVNLHTHGSSENATIPLEGVGDYFSSLARPEKTKCQRLSAQILLERGRFLERKLAPFRLPRLRARAMSQLDLVSATPLDAESVFTLFPRSHGESGDQRYFVVKREPLSSIIAALRLAGIRVLGISLQQNENILNVDIEDSDSISGNRLTTRIHRRSVAAGASLFILGLLATMVHASWRLNEASSELDATVEQVTTAAKSVTAAIAARQLHFDRIRRIAGQKANALPLVSIWEEMTRIIPDSAWVSDLSVKEGVVVFSGFAASAAGLIPGLEASPMFQSPVFTSPVIKAPGKSGERFTIQMGIEQR